jgi:RNA polymerase sigma-70 factor (ECF subfamily)
MDRTRLSLTCLRHGRKVKACELSSFVLMMNTTSASLLARLREPAAHDAWGRFVQLYTPLLYTWSRRVGLAEADASDLVQDVFTILVQKLPEFRYDPVKGFRRWLRTVLLNRWRDHLRRQAPPMTGEALDEVEAQAEELFGEAEYRQHLLNRALQLMQSEFSPKTWQACWEHVVVGRPAADVAAQLGISVGSVYVAKSRVLCRLREELAGLID